MDEDALPANAVMLYLILFQKFNRSCWRQEWMKFTLQQLMAFSHVGSPNTVYSMRSLLKELGYIDYLPAQNGNRSQTEYRLLPLFNTPSIPHAPEDEFSKSERRTDNSLIDKDKDKDKKRNTTHVTTATDQADNKNINEKKSKNINITKAPMTVKEFCQTA